MSAGTEKKKGGGGGGGGYTREKGRKTRGGRIVPGHDRNVVGLGEHVSRNNARSHPLQLLAGIQKTAFSGFSITTEKR